MRITKHSFPMWFNTVREIQRPRWGWYLFMRRIRFDSMAPASSVTRSGTDLRRYGACTGGVMDAPRRSWRGSFLLSTAHLFSLRVNRVSIESMGELCRSFHVSTVEPMSLDWFRVLRQPSTRHRSSRTTPVVATSQWRSHSFCHWGLVV
jgi:hypothetical protein